VRQQAIRYRYSTGVDEYMQRIESKTATLLAASCDIGASLAGVSPGVRSSLHEYGRMLGLAFQIADDVLDYLGSEGEIGKPSGKDITEGFATLPLMLAMEDGTIAKQLKDVLQDGRELSAPEALAVVDIVRQSGAPERALERARQYASAASRQIDAIALKDVRDALVALTGYVVSRKL
jgi:geranylgeranyl pyrophosphate synthase